MLQKTPNKKMRAKRDKESERKSQRAQRERKREREHRKRESTEKEREKDRLIDEKKKSLRKIANSVYFPLLLFFGHFLCESYLCHLLSH